MPGVAVARARSRALVGAAGDPVQPTEEERVARSQEEGSGQEGGSQEGSGRRRRPQPRRLRPSARRHRPSARLRPSARPPRRRHRPSARLRPREGSQEEGPGQAQGSGQGRLRPSRRPPPRRRLRPSARRPRRRLRRKRKAPAKEGRQEAGSGPQGNEEALTGSPFGELGAACTEGGRPDPSGRPARSGGAGRCREHGR